MKPFLFLLVLAWLFSVQPLLAADPIPVRWKEMNMDDVNPAPYKWKGPCEFQESLAEIRPSCWAFLHVPATSGRFNHSVTVMVNWHNKVPSNPNWKICGGDEYLHVRVHKLTKMEGAGMGSKRAAVGVRFQGTENANKDVLRRIGKDILRKFELYALSCPLDGTASEASPTTQPERTRPPAPASPSAESDIPSAHAGGDVHMPECNHLGVLGQRDLGSEHLPCEPTPAVAASGAYREQPPLPSVFPPGTEIVLLQAWAGSAGADTRDSETWVPFEKRHYGHLVANQMEYLFWELEIRYPREAHRKQFIIETVVYKDGKEFARYKSQPKSIVPDESRVHGVGAGWDGGGFWTPGTYNFEFLVDGEPLTATQVQVK